MGNKPYQGKGRSMADIWGRNMRWTECGHPRRVTYANRHVPPLPCGKPTVNGIACAKHAKHGSVRALFANPHPEGGET